MKSSFALLTVALITVLGCGSSSTAPTITEVAPSSGSTAGGTVVTITGTDFDKYPEVRLGGMPCEALTTVSSTELICTTPEFSPYTIDSTVDVTVTNINREPGILEEAFTFVAPEITSWTYVDHRTENGLNKDASQFGSIPRMTVVDSKLYAAWVETQDFAGVPKRNQIRVAVYNADDTFPAWRYVDRVAPSKSGINRNPTQDADQVAITSANGILYVAWREEDQIFLAQYNGDDASPGWTYPTDAQYGQGNGLRLNDDAQAETPDLMELDSKLYIVWAEKKVDSPNYKVHSIRFDTVDNWQAVHGGTDGTLNKESDKDARTPRLVVWDDKLFAIWIEQHQSNNSYQVRVSEYSGTDFTPSWNLRDGNQLSGLNHASDLNGEAPSLGVAGGKLYAIWSEETADSGPKQIRVKVYAPTEQNLNVWKSIDGGTTSGINLDVEESATSPHLIAFNNKLYASWQETLVLGNGETKSQVRIVRFNGNEDEPVWPFVDGNGLGGINYDMTVTAQTPWLCPFNNKLYAAWQEEHNDWDGVRAQIRVSVGR